MITEFNNCFIIRLPRLFSYFNHFLAAQGSDLPFFSRKRGSNRPRSIYQYSNMAPRLSGQTSIFGVVFFVFKVAQNSFQHLYLDGSL